MNNFIFPKNKKVIYNRFSEIVSTGSYFPPKIVSNDEIIDNNNINISEKIIKKTVGTEFRHEAEKGTTDSDILVEAAQKCLKKANLKPEQLSKLIVTKFLGDRILPMTAAIVQRKLKSNLSFHALDIDGGINSFIHAVDLSTKYISTTDSDNEFILILSGGINRLTMSKKDPRLAFLFGDGAGAILIKSSNENHFLGSYQYSNHELYDYAGSRNLKFSHEVSNAIFQDKKYSLLYDLYILNNWKDYKDFYINALKITKENLLEQSNLTFDNIDFVLLTENNRQMYELALEELEIKSEKTISVINKYGNTMSGMLPILLDESFNRGIIKKGMNIMFLSYGEGISGGGFIYKV